MLKVSVVLAFAVLCSAGGAFAQESKVVLKEGPGKDKAMQCGICHSLDYIPMNSRFLDKKGWTATVSKMRNVLAAPIPGEDVDTIAEYLAQNYGKPTSK